MFGVNQGAESLLFHAVGHDAAKVTCQLPAQQFRPGRQGKGDTAEGTPSESNNAPVPQHYLNADIVTFTEVSKDPKGMEWLWNPQIVGIYNRLLQRCELNKHTTEAASGALQNITAGDRRVRPGDSLGVPTACPSQPCWEGGTYLGKVHPELLPVSGRRRRELAGSLRGCLPCSGRVC